MPAKIHIATQTLKGHLHDLNEAEAPSEADILLVGGKKINLAVFPKLSGIFKTGVGTDNLPFEEANERGIQIQLPSDETQKFIFEETANFACNLILSSLYRSTGCFETWQKASRPFLGKKTVLVIGMGRIGQLVRKKTTSFCHVETYDVRENEEGELENLIRRADCISLHIPLSDDTKNFIDTEKLSWMKNGASLVNTARGPIIDEMALLTELTNERIYAALDVFSEEPYQGPLRDLPDDAIILTPHIASTCNEFLEETAKDFMAFVKKIEANVDHA